MKAHVLEGINQLIYKEVEMPRLKPHEVLVEVKAAGICGSDVPRVFETGTYHFPTVPGHEFAGIVVGAYYAEDSVWEGRRVGVFPLIPCKKCPQCMKKQYEMCSDYNYLGSRCDGGFAEYVAVPVWNLIELPDKISYEEAAMLEPASVALHAVRRMELEGVQSVVLFGLGTIGILIAEWLHILGITVVFATGHSEEHGALMKMVSSIEYRYLDERYCDVAEEIMKATDGLGVDAVVDCVGTSESIKDAITCVVPGGQIIEVGNPKADVSLEKNAYWKILRKQIRLTGTWNSTFTHEGDDDWHMTLKECEVGELNLMDLITHRLSLEDLHRGLELMRDKKEYRNKIMILKK